MTTDEANAALETAIRDWLNATNPDTEDIVVTSWTLVSEAIPVAREGEMISITSSDNLRTSHQLGLLQGAAAYVQQLIADSMCDE